MNVNGDCSSLRIKSAHTHTHIFFVNVVIIVLFFFFLFSIFERGRDERKKFYRFMPIRWKVLCERIMRNWMIGVRVGCCCRNTKCNDANHFDCQIYFILSIIEAFKTSHVNARTIYHSRTCIFLVPIIITPSPPYTIQHLLLLLYFIWLS